MTRGKTAQEPFPAEFYDEAYYTDGSKSAYAPYGPGGWADWITEMVVGYLKPESVLDVGCAYGYVVERLDAQGIHARGFDISHFAISRGPRDLTWQGDAADPEAWDKASNVDLVLATEVPEHLTEEQSETFIELAFQYGDRALLLIATGIDDGHATDGDKSHINVKPMSWWEDLAVDKGWVISDASLFNDDNRSSQMGWANRWIYLIKEA